MNKNLDCDFIAKMWAKEVQDRAKKLAEFYRYASPMEQPWAKKRVMGKFAAFKCGLKHAAIRKMAEFLGPILNWLDNKIVAIAYRLGIDLDSQQDPYDED